jgi:hypothetical protein
MSQKNIVSMFNCFLVKSLPKKSAVDHSLISQGVVTDFTPTPEFKMIVNELFKPLNVTTLFSREERLKGDVNALLVKQFLHYVEVYGLGVPGLFELEVTDGQIVKPVFIKAVDKAGLALLVQALIYTNAPIKDVDEVYSIIKDFQIPYEFERIENNELRAKLFDPLSDKFAKGDDAVRWLVLQATGKTMVIKNERTITSIKAATIDPAFFENNVVVLSEVFNRFKPLLLAAKKAKGRSTKSAFGALAKLNMPAVSDEARINNAINKIARLSKKNHKPVHEGVNKRYLSTAIELLNANRYDRVASITEKLSVRDKMKILNLIEYKIKGFKVDVFVIRSGVSHVKPNRPVLDAAKLEEVKKILIAQLTVDLAGLHGKKILLDANVDYGLPVSRKQTFGNLPFGTTIKVDGTLSAGVYWENSWGATDIDLSTVDVDGLRTGWGGSRGYTAQDLVFSGDMTYADTGAMEFYTNNNSNNKPYGLFANIYNGEQNAGVELVVGTSTDKKWMDNCVVRERSQLLGRGSIVGFVADDKFRVFQLKLNDRIANFGEANPIIKRAMVDYWTVSKLLDAVGIPYELDRDSKISYDHDLSYANFSIDKLEAML